MTTLTTPDSSIETIGGSGRHQGNGRSSSNRPRINVGSSERIASVGAGSVLALEALRRHNLTGLIIGAVGGALIYRGTTGHCSTYQALGVDTNKDTGPRTQQFQERSIHVEQSFLINREPGDLYHFWRHFQNLPGIMSHLISVEVIDDKRSHWVAKAPRVAGGQIAWDAEITRDEPDSRIAWQSLPGSAVDSRGEIAFKKAMGDRGTEVHVYMDYLPPAGKLGHWVATLFGESPRRQMREDLRNFKRLMECGEIPTVEGQPAGSCTGLFQRRGS